MAETVRVVDMMPPGHVRTPSYLRGKKGWIERRLGEFRNPEQAAYGLEAQMVPLFRVRFSMGEIWGTEAENPDDTVDAEIFGHWLSEIKD